MPCWTLKPVGHGKGNRPDVAVPVAGTGGGPAVLGRNSACRIHDVDVSRKQLTAVQPSDRKGAIVVTVAGARPSMVKLEPSAGSALQPGESAALKHGGQPAAAVPGSGSQPPEPASRAKQRRRGRGPGGFPRRCRWPRSQTIPNGRATTTKGRRLRRTGATTPRALSRSPSVATTQAAAAKRGGWSSALTCYINHKSAECCRTESTRHHEDVLYRDDDVTVFWDKYPKARCHFLVMPHARPDLADARCLTQADVPLLDGTVAAADALLEEMCRARSDTRRGAFKMGFRAVPSMDRLHMHVVSQDFDSTCLKNKKHWNSFATDFFVTVDTVRAELAAGRVADFRSRKDRLKSPLRCHVCAQEIGTCRCSRLTSCSMREPWRPVSQAAPQLGPSTWSLNLVPQLGRATGPMTEPKGGARDAYDRLIWFDASEVREREREREGET